MIFKTQHPYYGIWAAMLDRCYRPKCKAFVHYGARGIFVCGWLKESVFNFASHLGPKPSRYHSLDRIDNDSGYTCGHCFACETNGWSNNVRWANREIQHKNRRCTVWIDLNGHKHTINELANKFHISRETIRNRIKAHKSGTELITAPHPKKNKITVIIDGETKSLKQWSKSSGISYMCLYKRLRRGISGSELLKTA